MKNYNKISKETGKISALSSEKNHKFEYPTGKEILPLDQSQMIEQVKLTYSPQGKGFKKQTKTIEDQREGSRSFAIFKP